MSDHLDAVRQVEIRASGASLVGQPGAGRGCSTPSAPSPNLFVSSQHNGAAGGVSVVAAKFVESFKVMAALFAMGVAFDTFRFGCTVVCCGGGRGRFPGHRCDAVETAHT